jgi:hypothetical protein
VGCGVWGRKPRDFLPLPHFPSQISNALWDDILGVNL